MAHLEAIKLVVKRGPIDNKPRELLIHPAFIRFEAENSSNPYLKIDKPSIKAYRFGVRWINGYCFTIGRAYEILIKDDHNQVLNIQFKSFYGIGKVDCHNLYSEILGNLWQYYFRDIANDLINAFWNDQEFSILDVQFSADGLKIKKSNMLGDEVLKISWDKVRIKDYQTYFVIYAADNAAKTNRSFSYLDDWNTDILHSVTKAILNHINER